MTQEITDLHTVRRTVQVWRAAGQTVALVPTMGALHAGHMALVARARTLAARVVVSIFVNPTQFGPHEDFERYPRPLADDLAALCAAGADAAWLPSVATMYPQGFATSIRITGITEMMDGISRPGHFDGVATVVTKLLHQVQPDMALFGEKDYQQLCLIKRLVSDLNMHIKIVGIETQREESGLARSSRNQYLSPTEQKIAPQIYATLQRAAQRIRTGEAVAMVLAQEQAALRAHGFMVEYLELRDGETLTALDHYRAPARLLVAAKLGATRLIDNMAVE